MRPGTTLNGTFATLPLVELLEFLRLQHATGVLVVSAEVDAKLMIVDGSLVLGLSSAGPSLQQVILGSGLTDSAGWRRADELARTSSNLADALVQVGVDVDQLRAVLREQCVGVLFELLLVPETAVFEFAAGETHVIGARFGFEHADLLVEAERRVDGWRRIARSVPSTGSVLRPVRHLDGPEVTVGAADWAVLALLDGRRTVADLITDLGLSAFVVCAQLHRLREAGLVEQIE